MLPSLRRLHAPLLLRFQTVATGRLTAHGCHVAGDAHVQARCRLLPNQSRQSLWTHTANRYLIAKGPILGFTRPGIGRRSRCRYRCCYYCLWRETTPRAEASFPHRAGFANAGTELGAESVTLESDLQKSGTSAPSFRASRSGGCGQRTVQLTAWSLPPLLLALLLLLLLPWLDRQCGVHYSSRWIIRSRRVADPSVGKERWIFNHARRVI
ncbi:uncharacterized protein LOC116802717 [Drosophila sechellia]|uniref:uncharacterized protein LOC116802717 n=1 Tax=Drosophila sechellia TaxID=7238 RepID=UPI0013DDD6D2|nr:uncharacterized protein LOC116802717 [Drosophila sechellia]